MKTLRRGAYGARERLVVAAPPKRALMSARECLANARLCEEMARRRGAEDHRWILLETAGHWRTLAKHANTRRHDSPGSGHEKDQGRSGSDRAAGAGNEK